MTNEMSKGITSRLNVIEKNMKSINIFSDMEAIAKDLINSLKEFDIIKKIELHPNDISGGSISFFIKTLPENIIIKLWHGNGIYKMALFRKHGGIFDEQLPFTFNQSGIIELKDLDAFEERILDFIANEIYNRDNTIILEGATSK